MAQVSRNRARLRIVRIGNIASPDADAGARRSAANGQRARGAARGGGPRGQSEAPAADAAGRGGAAAQVRSGATTEGKAGAAARAQGGAAGRWHWTQIPLVTVMKMATAKVRNGIANGNGHVDAKRLALDG